MGPDGGRSWSSGCVGGGIRRKLDELVIPEVSCVRAGSSVQSPELPARALVKRDKLGVGFGGSSVSSGVLMKTVLTPLTRQNAPICNFHFTLLYL